MRVVAEPTVRKPAQGDTRRCNRRERIPGRKNKRVTFQTRLAPQQILVGADLLGDPLTARERADARRNELPGQTRRRVEFAKGGGMRGGVVLKFLHQKSVNDFRIVVGRGLVEAGIELERMAGKARVGVGRRGHQCEFTALLIERGKRNAGGKCSGARRNFPAAGERDAFHARRAIRPCASRRTWTMAIAAGERYAATIGAKKIRAQMNLMVELDAARILEIGAQRGEFGMLGEREHGANEMRRAEARFEVRMALDAGRIANRDESHASLMLDVTRGAGGREGLVRVMNRSIVAGQAGLVGDRMAEGSGASDVACGAILAEECVRSRDRSHTVGRTISRYSRDDEPEKRQRGKRDRKDEAPAAKRVRTLEVRKFDALREFFCSSRTTWQIFAPNSLSNQNRSAMTA